MNEKEFVVLVNRLELYERDHPAMYRLRVGLLAALGYLVLFGSLGGALLFVVGVIYLGRVNVLIISLIYRVRQTWIQMLETAEKHRTDGLGLFVRFSNCYAPYFNAYSFVLARAQEYEPDRCAVTV